MNTLFQKLVNGNDLSADEMTELFSGCLNHENKQILLGGLLSALATKGESTEEIFGLVSYLRSKMIQVPGLTDALDTCGTGGDYANTINASTISAFVCAANGVKIAKHGNRASTSKCGGFDLLEALGVNINLSPDQALDCFKKTGITFLYAPNFHPTFKEISPIRKALGIKTIFNYMGPLLNPGLVKNQLIGVANSKIIQSLAKALMTLGSQRVVIVHSTDGLDEVSTAGPSEVYVFEKDQNTKQFIIEPPQTYSLDEVRGGGPKENAERTKHILDGKGTPAENMFVALNSGLALFTAGKVETFEEGLALAQQTLKVGSAYQVLQDVIANTNKK